MAILHSTDMKKVEMFFLTILLLGGMFARLYRFNNPIADWHSWRQADTSSVSRNFIKFGFDVLHPRFDDLSNVPSGFDNPHGYRFVEFPIYNVLQAGTYKYIGHLSLEEWGRIVTIVVSLLSSLFVYLILRKYAGIKAAAAGLLFFLFNPFSIYYGRVILPDPTMVAATLGAIYFYDKTLDKKTRGKQMLFFFISLLFGIAALLTKPYAIFFFLPILVISYNKWHWRVLYNPYFWLFFIVSIIPFGLWRLWMMQYPAGIPVSNWLFNGGNIRFTGAYFYWIFADRISRLILGYWGIVLLVVGFLSKKSRVLFFSFLVSSLTYVIVIARGNVQHDYYQILILPTLAVFVGLGFDFLISLSKEATSRWAIIPVIVICFLFSEMFGWYIVRDYFNINNPSIVVAGRITDQLTPKNAKVIALYDGDTSFLYQTKRSGWTSFEKSLPEMIQMGAGYIVIANPTPNDFNGLGKQYKVLASSSQYLLLDLTHKP